MATSPLFGWEEPDDTDLVKDGAAAIRTLGNAIDTSMGDLLGGTTGQVLAKNSNTNMDFTWVTSDDANAIQNAIVDAKGDLIGATAADTPARLAVGTNGQVLTADSTTATGLAWATPSVPNNLFYAGKNKIINGDFGVWQRGTTFTPSATGFFLFADRFRSYTYSASATTASQQTFTAGTAPVAGYEGTFFGRVVSTNTFAYFSYNGIENVRNFAGQTVTLSYWAKSASGQTLNEVQVAQYFGSTGSAAVNTNLTAPTITTSWARYTHTFTMPSITGKTIGGGNDAIFINIKGAINNALDLWGFQLEAGSTATEFQTASGSIGGELALCQRYYVRSGLGGGYGFIGSQGFINSATAAYHFYSLPVTMRVKPSSVDYGGTLGVKDTSNVTTTVSSIALSGDTSPSVGQIDITSTGMTSARASWLVQNNSATAYIGFSAEL